MWPSSFRRIWLSAGFAFLASGARSAQAIDAFEIQVYDGTATPPGALGLELHVNHVLSGAATGQAPELPPRHRTTLTLEPSFGVLDFWELGAYLQTALRADGEFDYAGFKLRSKFITPPGWNDRFRLGVNLEFSVIPRIYDRDRYGSEVRPIVAWEDEHWLFAFNPILTFALTAGAATRGPALEPCLLLQRKLGPIALGLEYYAGLGPVAELVPWAEQDQYLFETIDLISVPRWQVNLGIGEGLSAASNAWTSKLNLSYEWDPLGSPSSQ